MESIRLSVHLFVCPCVWFCMDDISSTVQPCNLVWWCIIMNKNWFTIFIVKVTVKAYITKMGLFLHLLNFRSVCNQTWFDSQCVLWKNWMTAFKVKVAVKAQNVSECLSGYLLNHRTFCCQTCYDYAASKARVSFRKIGSLSSMSRSQQKLI